MKKFNEILFIGSLLIASIMLVFTGCESTSEPSDTGTLLVKVTDDPFPTNFVESADVIISKIELRIKDDLEGNPFIVVAEGEFKFDLLELRNGVTAALPEIDIPVGAYDLVRLYIKSATIVLAGGLGEFNLKVPSGAETGIKIFIQPELQIQGGLTAELLLDFDLSNSFIAQGNKDTPAGINGFIFTPAIRAVNNSLAGSIYGVVTDEENEPLEGVLVTVTLEETSATAITDASGYYEILGLKVSEDYSLAAVLEGYQDNEVNNVPVIANQKTEKNFVLKIKE